MKAHEVSKVLNIPFKELKEKAKQANITINSPNQKLTDEQISLIEELISPKTMTQKEVKDQKEENLKNVEVIEKPTKQRINEEEKIKEVELTPPITVDSLAEALNIHPNQIVQILFSKGHLISKNSTLDINLANEIAIEFNTLIKLKSREERVEEEEELWVSRPPVVTIMGHVDHGKTTLLDTIRKTNIANLEAGGITQHIGAYQIEFLGKRITFIDTPGHEAFTTLRARGTMVTDIVILVVAADDGVMPQTIEAINHAKAAGVPIIVAINKIDKPNANIDRVKNQLVTYGLIPEEWGGQTPFVEISAKYGKNINTLLEIVLLVAELMELKANIAGKPEGIVIESKLDKNRGPVATIIVKKGILKPGMAFYIGKTWGKIRAMYNERGQQLKEAPPSTPVEIMGIAQVPNAGEKLIVVENEKIAKEIATENQKIEEYNKKFSKSFSIQDLLSKLHNSDTFLINTIIKTDTQGSLEAIKAMIEKLATEKVKPSIIHSAIGNISDSDVLLAKASNAIIVGFNIKIEANAKKIIEKEGIPVYLHNIIYELIDNFKKLIEGKQKPEEIEVEIGEVQVKQIFKVKNGKVAGCYVLNGKITRDSKVVIERNREKIFEGFVESLRRFQEDVKEVIQGYECGIKIKDFNDFQVGDTIRVFIKTIKE
ncbi:MAG: translation initiation factor IF-2 [Candidatus Calescibacterium sp.]|nr:translation initiation factor IF-2 [Candidatus Calescibacterium sp.]MCX7972040.1 translation initiation factor IF-2 [bacterium]MDW8194676.1 translation initiation factor IF-2 [Candidatus Calescibacterium sp.]